MNTLDLSILTKLKTKKINRLSLYTWLYKTRIHKKSFEMMKKKYGKFDLYHSSYKKKYGPYCNIGKTTQILREGSSLLM